MMKSIKFIMGNGEKHNVEITCDAFASSLLTVMLQNDNGHIDLKKFNFFCFLLDFYT